MHKGEALLRRVAHRLLVRLACRGKALDECFAAARKDRHVVRRVPLCERAQVTLKVWPPKVDAHTVPTRDGGPAPSAIDVSDSDEEGVVSRPRRVVAAVRRRLRCREPGVLPRDGLSEEKGGAVAVRCACGDPHSLPKETGSGGKLLPTEYPHLPSTQAAEAKPPQGKETPKPGNKIPE